MLKHLFASVALPALVSLATVATAQSQDAAAVASATAPAEDGDSDWAFEESDIPVDPGFVFGRLDNGMRYIIRQNDTPAGQGLVRMHIEAGAIDEREGESGYAHYLEHMAFNGSTNVPEGEMVKLLERKGLAFGADTNAQTGYDHTRYKLDLPNNSEDLLDTALMLMRETAGELTFAPEAVDRERGVMLAEKRDRNNFAYRNGRDGLEFAYPGSRLSRNEIAGTVEDLENATSERLRAFWMREYVPAATTLIVVGDFDPAMVEAKIRAEFSDWQREGAVDQADFGPVNPARAGLTDIHLDPSLPEIVDFSRHGAYVDEPDTIARRKENTLRSIAYGIIARRIARIARSEDPPFRGAAFSTSDVFDAGRTTSLVVQTVDGEWQRGVDAVVGEYTRAMAFGFTEAEVAEQVANRRNGLETATANQDTRSNATLNGAIFFQDVQDFQENFFTGTNFRVLNSDVESYGLELDGSLIPMEGLTLQGGYAYTKAERKTDVVTPLGNGQNQLLASSGTQLSLTPEHVITASGTYLYTVTPNLNALFHINARYNSEHTTSAATAGIADNDAYTLVGGRIGLQSADGRWEFSVFGENLTDEYYNLASFAVPEQTGTIAVYPGIPAMYGAELKVNF